MASNLIAMASNLTKKEHLLDYRPFWTNATTTLRACHPHAVEILRVCAYLAARLPCGRCAVRGPCCATWWSVSRMGKALGLMGWVDVPFLPGLLFLIS